MNHATAEGAWKEAKGKIKNRWGQLSDDELTRAEGSLDQLTGYIQRKTGETREAIEQYLDSIGAIDAWNDATERLSNLASSATEAVQQTAAQAAEQVRAGYIQTRRLVEQRPLESMAVTFGVGLVIGLVTGLIARSR